MKRTPIRTTETNSDGLMVVIAWLYYLEDLTHDQIARRLGIPRIKVTRLLQKARREGIVEFRITRPLPQEFELQQRLLVATSLKEAFIVQSRRSFEETLEAVGKAAADHLHQHLRNDLRIGMGWSTTVSRMAPYIHTPKRRYTVTVCDLAGTMVGQSNPYSISWLVAQRLNATLKTLSAPVLVASEETRQTLLQEPSLRQALEEVRRVDIAYVGLGHVGPDTTLVRVGLLSPHDIQQLQERGVVGEMLMRYYDKNGQHVPCPWESRIISLEWQSIRQIPHVVVIAAGDHKVEAITAAIRGRLCHTLITDTDTALKVIECFQQVS
ncbi:MAG: sugar-binding transcriptional regulator [Chloroflexus sp.]|nr:sugar-binding transcriptional regulator [Chloroflexus sp.]